MWSALIRLKLLFHVIIYVTYSFDIDSCHRFKRRGSFGDLDLLKYWYKNQVVVTTSCSLLNLFCRYPFSEAMSPLWFNTASLSDAPRIYESVDKVSKEFWVLAGCYSKFQSVWRRILDSSIEGAEHETIFWVLLRICLPISKIRGCSRGVGIF